MSSTCSTELDILRRLGNQKCVDVPAAEPRGRKLACEMRAAIDKAMAKKEGDAAPSPAAGAVVAEEAAEATPAAAPIPPPAAPVPAEDRGETAAEQETPKRSSALSEAMLHAAEPAALPAPVQAAREAPTPEPLPRPPREPPQEPPAPREPPARRPRDDSDSDGGGRGRAGEGERLEKQGFLIELQSLESRGARLSRRFSMKDSLTELEFEVSKQTSLLTTQSTVAFMRESLRLLVNGVELANNRLGPFLVIDGWAEGIVTDMSRFNAPLEKIYKRYWRKQQVSPIMELGWIILGSLVMTHFKNKLFGARREEAPPPAPAPPRTKPAPHYGAAPAGPRGRATLRPPTSLFNL